MTPADPENDPEEYMSLLRDRITQARQVRGLTFAESSARTGLTSFPAKMEAGLRVHVFLYQALAISQGYDVSLRWLFQGSGDPPHNPPCLVLDTEAILWRVAHNLRALRGSRGLKTVAREAWGSGHTTLCRWESRTYQPDIARLWQLARYYKVSVFRLVTEDFTGESR